MDSTRKNKFMQQGKNELESAESASTKKEAMLKYDAAITCYLKAESIEEKPESKEVVRKRAHNSIFLCLDSLSKKFTDKLDQEIKLPNDSVVSLYLGHCALTQKNPGSIFIFPNETKLTQKSDTLARAQIYSVYADYLKKIGAYPLAENYFSASENILCQTKKELNKDKSYDFPEDIKDMLHRSRHSRFHCSALRADKLIGQAESAAKDLKYKAALDMLADAKTCLSSARMPTEPLLDEVIKIEKKWDEDGAKIIKSVMDKSTLKETDYDVLIKSIGNIASVLPNNPSVRIMLDYHAKFNTERYRDMILSRAANSFIISTDFCIFKDIRLEISDNLLNGKNGFAQDKTEAELWKTLACNPNDVSSYYKLANYLAKIEAEDEHDSVEREVKSYKESTTSNTFNLGLFAPLQLASKLRESNKINSRNWEIAQMLCEWIAEKNDSINGTPSLDAKMLLATMQVKRGHGLATTASSLNLDKYPIACLLQVENADYRARAYDLLVALSKKKPYDTYHTTDSLACWKSLVTYPRNTNGLYSLLIMYADKAAIKHELTAYIEAVSATEHMTIRL